MVILKGILDKFSGKPNRLVWVLAALFSFLALGEFRSKIGITHRIEEPRLLIARRSLKEGEAITSADLDYSANDKGVNKPGERYFTDQDLPLVLGKQILTDIEKGNPIRLESIWVGREPRPPKSIPRGMRAFFIETASFYWAYPGAKVDLVLVPNQETNQTLTLIENVLVLSIETEREAPGVTVALSPAEIEQVNQHLRQGKIALAIRNPADRDRGAASKKGKRQILKRVKVELITEEK
jgi:Flp pilus assembly protein CpaB